MWTGSFHFQAHFRGYRVRRILFNALEGARKDFARSDDCDFDDDDFNYDQEVDLSAFEFKDDGHDWRPNDTPQLPSRQVFFCQILNTSILLNFNV